VGGGEPVDPSGGREDLELREIRAVSESIFEDDPLRLLRAVRLADELEFTIAPLTRRLIVDNAPLVTQAAGERVLAELGRLNVPGYRLLDELGLLAPLGGAIDDRLDRLDDPRFRLVAVFGRGLDRLPVSREDIRYMHALLHAEPPPDGSPAAVHLFRRATEPWAIEALAYVGALELAPAVEAARARDPAEPLVRGNELGLPPGPEIGRLLSEIELARVKGEISTRAEALALAQRLRRER
jgi:tRNA nucleotidyltransferase/poly(A) polymerase